jgi:hypothetical protein
MRISDLVASYTAGQNSLQMWRKNPTQTTGTSIWFDLSMSPGTPAPNYYIGTPYTSTALARSSDGGFNHGPNVSPLTKYFHKFMAMTQTTTAVPLPLVVMDYLMFYPFLEQSDGTASMTNSITLPRYPTGAGVQIMPVLTNAQVGGTTFSFSYTNSSGVAGRTTATVTANSQTVAGTLINTSAATAAGRGPFVPLQAGDSGVRSIESVTITGSDIGLFAAVLVKPLLTTMIYDITAPVETDLIIDKNVVPTIVDDAFLSAICLPSGTVAGSAIIGELSTYWS